RFGPGPRQAGADLDGGEVDGRQVADRQEPVRHDAEHHDPEDDQRRRDRPLDEDLGKVHDAAFGAGAPGPDLMLTRRPCTRRICAAVTTVYPGITHLFMTD